MNEELKKLVNLGAIKTLAETIKTKIDEAKDDEAIKSVGVSGNTISFYNTNDKSGTAAFTVDFPTEFFLDQTKTKFIDNFTWSEELYPNTTDPELNNKPVMVLAVKGSDNSVEYSFVSLSTLLNTYIPKATGKDNSTTITIDGYEIEVSVNISEENGNAIQTKDDGLYVASVNIGVKADKVSFATENNIAILTEDGNLADGGKKVSDLVEKEEGKGLSTNDYTTAEQTKLSGISVNANKVETSETLGNIKIDGIETTIFSIASDTEVSNILDEVFSDGE